MKSQTAISVTYCVGVDIIGQPIYVKHFTNGSRTDFSRGA